MWVVVSILQGSNMELFGILAASVTSVFSKWSKCGTDVKDLGVLLVLLSFNKTYYRARRFWCNSNARMRTVLLVFWLQRTGRETRLMRRLCFTSFPANSSMNSDWIQHPILQSAASSDCLHWFISMVQSSFWALQVDWYRMWPRWAEKYGKVEPVIKRDAIWCHHDFWILLDSFGCTKPLSGSSWQIQHNFHDVCQAEKPMMTHKVSNR